MRLVTSAPVCSLALVSASCAMNRTDLTETGDVDVKIDDGSRSAVRYVHVYFDEEDGETVIRGKVYGIGRQYGKHVHVTVVSRDGQVIAEEQPRLIWQIRKKGKRTGSTGTGRFTVRLPQAVPSGTVVDVVYHDAFHRSAPTAG